MYKSLPLSNDTQSRIFFKISLVNLIFILGTMSAIIYHYCRFAFIASHAPFFSSFLHAQINIFCDFYYLFDNYVRLKFNSVINYFPGSFNILQVLNYISNSQPYLAIQFFLVFYLGLLLVYFYYSFNDLKLLDRLNTTIIWAFFSYPVLLTLDTGNFEGICFLLIAFSIWFCIKKQYIYSATLIGFAASIKLYPAIFLFVILNKKNKKKCILTFLISFMFFLLIPFLQSPKTFIINFVDWIHAFQAGIIQYKEIMYSYKGEHFGHSLINAIRIFTGPKNNINQYLYYYYPIAFISIFLLIINIYKINAFYEKILIANIIICLFPITSTDYKLQFFLIPLIMLCKSKRFSFQNTILCTLIALTQIPKGFIFFYQDYFKYHFDSYNPYININIILNPIIFIIILIVIFTQKSTNRKPLLENLVISPKIHKIS